MLDKSLFYRLITSLLNKVEIFLKTDLLWFKKSSGKNKNKGHPRCKAFKATIAFYPLKITFDRFSKWMEGFLAQANFPVPKYFSPNFGKFWNSQSGKK